MSALQWARLFSSKLNPRAFSFFLLPSLFFLTSGCSTISYIYQAGRGQLALSNRARPISAVLQSDRTPQRIKELLSEIPDIKKFTEQNGLKPTKNYTEYVELNRPSAVWVVTASDKLRFAPRSWSFPLVGSFTYLGWFDRKDADNFAKVLDVQNLDVDVRGARAYSTLGWFTDPILSTMIPAGERALGDLVNVVVHESVHATIYIKDQAFFNESIASFIADKLTPEYLKRARGAGSQLLTDYLAGEKASENYYSEMHDAYNRLSGVYASAISDEEKLKQKQRILDALRSSLKISRPINNASLIQFRTYRAGVKEFERVFDSYERAGGDIAGFIQKVKASVTDSSFERKHQEDLLAVTEALVK